MGGVGEWGLSSYEPADTHPQPSAPELMGFGEHALF